MPVTAIYGDTIAAADFGLVSPRLPPGNPPYTYSDLTDRIARLALRRAWKRDRPFGIGSLKAAIAEVAPTPLMSKSLD